MRLHALPQGKRHSRRVVRVRLNQSRGVERRNVARRRLPRRPRSISRLVPKLASRRHRHAGPRAVQTGRHARLDSRRRRPPHVEIRRQRRAAQRNLRKMGRGSASPLTTSQDYHADMRFSEPMMTQLAESYRKIRNTFRFALGNLANFDPARDAVADNELSEIDAWMLHRTGELVAKCRVWYDEFEF